MTGVVVVDASAALRALLPGQTGHAEARGAFGSFHDAGIELVAPDLFPFEIGTVISRASGRPAEKARLLVDALELVRILPLDVDRLARALEIAAASRLTFHDAAYAALAEAENAPLCTEDQGIRSKARDVATDAVGALARASRWAWRRPRSRPGRFSLPKRRVDAGTDPPAPERRRSPRPASGLPASLQTSVCKRSIPQPGLVGACDTSCPSLRWA